MRLNYGVSGGFTALKRWTSSIISESNSAARMHIGLFLVFAVLAAGSVFAATTGSISGTARDAQGAVIPNAKVELRNTLTGVMQSVTTDSAGFYNFPSLPIGHYDISFESAGFDKYVEKEIVIDVDTERRVDATLKPGGVSEQVTVTATADHAQVDTETSQMGEVIGSAEMEAVPLDGRNYTDLLALQPGVVPINVQWYNSAAPPNDGNDGALSISGGQNVHSGYYVNGANTVDLSGGGTFLIPTLDSIAEFRIVTNNAGAEYGGFSAGIVNVVTKSGTNQFHGDAFEYLRNGSLNAKSYSLLGAPVGAPALHQNIFGGTVGGPIRRNKVFFFFDYQGLRNSDSSNADRDLLSDAERGGDLTAEASAWGSNAKTVGSDYMASVLNQRMGRSDITPGEYYFQHTTNGVVDYDCNAPGNACVFPTGVIPSTALDPLAQNIMKTFLPHANTTVNGKPHYFLAGGKQTWTENKEAGRVDATTRLGQLSGYFHYDPWSQFVPGAWGPTVPGFGQDAQGTAILAVASLSTPLGSSAANNFVASWTYNRNIGGNLPSSGPTTLGSLGWTTPGDQGGIVQITSGAYQMLPSFSWGDLGPQASGGGPGTVNTQFNNDYQGEDDISKVYKTHTLKFGGQYHWDLISIGKSQNASNGYFGIGNAETGLGDADWLLGVTSSFAQGAPYVEGLRNFYVAAYGEDSWRATKDLTLNYGLRWEVNPFWREEHNRCPMVVKGVQSTRFPNAPTGYVFPGDPGIPEHLVNINWHDFAPRFGVAYTPDFSRSPLLRAIFGDYGKSSIRAGYGLYYTNIEGYNTFNFSAGPYGLYTAVNNGTLEAPFYNRKSGMGIQPFPVTPGNYNWALISKGTFRTPFTHEASPYEEDVDFSLQRQVAGKTIVQLSYVGTFGHHLDVVYDGNNGDPAIGAYLSNPANVTDGNTFWNYGGEDGNNVYHGVNGITYYGTRENLGPSFRGVGFNTNVGNSNYHALETTVRHNSERSTLLFAYTWSKAIDNGSGRGDQIFQENPKFFRGLSLYDVPQNLSVTYSYELPIDKFIHGNDRFTRGWKFSGTTRASNGVPIWIREDDDNNFRGDFKNSAWGVGTDEPELARGNIKGDHNPRHGRAWMNTSLYSTEPLGQQGNSPRRSIIGPGVNNTDFAMMKDIKVKEGISLTLRAEFFNAWNHAQWNGSQVISSDWADSNGAPVFDGSGNNSGGTFGLTGGAQDMRKGQLNATLHF